MALIRPRLTDFHGIHLAQEEIDFAIPYLDEDIPLYVDPFLLWKSPSQQDNALHISLVASINHVVDLAVNGREIEAATQIRISSECPEVGLGYSATRKGKRLSEGKSLELVKTLLSISHIKEHGLSHVEEIQFLLDEISKDRISDISASYLKSFLIDYTIDQCTRFKIPIQSTNISGVFDSKQKNFIEEKVQLPINPESGKPILLVPKRWLRKVPWISADNYIHEYLPKTILNENELHQAKGEILNFNRLNFGLVSQYVAERERKASDCHNDPLFSQIPVLSAKRKFSQISRLPTGKERNADKKFEDLTSQLLTSLLYPHLDFADIQSRTVSGTLIRDLVFYNNRSVNFFDDIFKDYDSRQIVFEMKNVGEVNTTHVNQLNRYLSNQFGRFGIIVTRNRVPSKVTKNTVDLWSGQRTCILFLDDSDVKLMTGLYESRQRFPYEVIAKKHAEFIRKTPS